MAYLPGALALSVGLLITGCGSAKPTKPSCYTHDKAEHARLVKAGKCISPADLARLTKALEPPKVKFTPTTKVIALLHHLGKKVEVIPDDDSTRLDVPGSDKASSPDQWTIYVAHTARGIRLGLQNEETHKPLKLGLHETYWERYFDDPTWFGTRRYGTVFLNWVAGPERTPPTGIVKRIDRALRDLAA